MSVVRGIRRALLALASAAAVAGAVASPAGAATAAQLNPPDSMAATGDSITVGFNACGGYVECTRRSWSAGDATDTNTHYVRLLAAGAPISGRNNNVAVSGAKIDALDDQLQAAAALNPKPKYVTVLLGANDVCGPSNESGITSVATFRSRFQTAMNLAAQVLPDARIYVVSVPNVYQLWEIGRNDWLSRTTWDTANICQALLANPQSTATADVQRRQRIRQRVIDYNTQLGEVCALVLRCRYDNGNAFNTSFTLDEISNFDSFHPNADGQKKVASVTWTWTFNFNDRTAPTTTLTPSRSPDGAGGWYDRAVDVTAGATDPNSSVKGHEYRTTTNGTFTRYSGPVAVTATGPTTLEARSVDINGNVSASASREVTIDPVEPAITLEGGDGGPGGPVVLRVTGTDDRAVHALTCSVDGQPATLTGTTTTTTERAGDVSVSTDGDHTVTCAVEDRAGNVRTAQKDFGVDATAPIASIDTAPVATNDTTPEFEFSSNEPDGATFECAIDGADLGDCESPYTLGDELAEGDHTFSVTTTDAAGNESAAAEATFTVDLTAPQTSIPTPPASPTNAPVSIEFESDESGGRFECSVDGAAAEPCVSPLALDLPDGPHTVAVTAIDAAGNAEAAAAEAQWTVDKRAPVASWISGPPADDDSTTATFEFESDESGASFDCKLDGNAWSGCASGDSFTVTDDGPHTLAVRATDAAGNASDQITHSWNVDTDAPETTLGSGGPNGVTSATSATFTFVTDDGTGFECELDGGGWNPCSSGATFSSLADGPHTLSVRARDAAGNRDATPATRGWTVDTQAPATQIDSAPAERVSSTTAQIAFSSSEGGVTFACRVDNGAWQANCTSPRTLTGLGQGTHSFEVRATDAGGNTDATPSATTWLVDTVAPSTTLESGPDGVTSSPDAEFVFSSNEDGTFECRLDSAGWGSCGSPKRYTDLADGDHTFEVRATDRTGNVDGTPARTEFSVDTAAPQTRVDSGPEGETLARDASFGFSSESAAAFECRVDSGAWGECGSPHSYVNVALGAHRFDVRAKDDAGNVDETPASRSWTVVAPTAPPSQAGDGGGGSGNGGGSGGSGSGSGNGGGSGGSGSGGGATEGVSLTVGLRESAKSDAADAWLTIDSGDVALKSATVKLPKGLLKSWRTAKPGSVGNLQIRSTGGSKVLRNLKLKLKKAGRKPVLVSSGGVKVVLTYSSTGTLKITGLPSGSTRVLITLKGGPLAFAPAATCQPTAWSVTVTGRTNGSAAARGTAPVACRGRRPRGG